MERKKPIRKTKAKPKKTSCPSPENFTLKMGPMLYVDTPSNYDRGAIGPILTDLEERICHMELALLSLSKSISRPMTRMPRGLIDEVITP